ncbi:bacterial transcriptional activator domain-containing protein [Acuticoccus sp. I52.16.1]|uniref:bacterial transcriptional activator domain-containing protein n=1 Tax=Acuticoccus sp. I52.16.1 TaxID=2928472 RepID=UPI001FCFC28F|nr:bacterial transcriptional activator domain-containing protein [Acuticoccus sp. I52.16.1]UOM34130.1 bacterial transcriptional activator domain-containing protein [Acuticoccus sp. I52.16.1]
MSLLRANEVTAPLIGSDRAHAWFAGDPTRSDLATFNRCLGAGTERAYREAARLWRGIPLADLETGEALFDEWIAQFRAETVSVTHKCLGKRLDSMPEATTPLTLQIAACELLIAIEPSDSEANERLLRLLLRDGQRAAAARQLRTYTHALKELDLAPSEELVDAVRKATGQVRPESLPQPHADYQPKRYADRPHVALIRARQGNQAVPDLLSFAHSEVIHQLTRFRSVRCFERDDRDDVDGRDNGLISRVGFSDALDHDYRLLLWDEPRAKSIYLRCVNARRQDTVSCVRISYECLDDRSSAETIIATAINSLEQDIIMDERPRTCASPFDRWLEAYQLLTQWSEASARAALPILEGLANEEEGKRLSLVHSSISSLLMIRRLTIPTSAQLARADQERAREAALQAIALDALEPFNHVVLGWMRMQANEHDTALLSFQDAVALNPYSAATVVAAAEANAYAGNVTTAQSLAEKAIALSGRYTPAYFYAYLANIAYLRGDLGQCIEYLRRAPESMHTATLMVAAQAERNDMKAAGAARVRFERELRQAEPYSKIDGSTLSKWLVSTNMHRDASVRRRMFSSLERAGLPVDAAM